MIEGETIISYENWHHYAVARDGDTVRMFLDGRLEKASAGHSGTIDGSHLIIGARYDRARSLRGVSRAGPGRSRCSNCRKHRTRR